MHRYLRFRQIHILVILQRFEGYNTLSVNELLYINKFKFLFYIKKCHNLQNFNRNQHIK